MDDDSPHAYAANTFISQENNFSHLMNAMVVPRPIAFVTTFGKNAVVNAAPFSYFNVVSKSPPLISLSIHKRGKTYKDTAYNILTSKEFVINICSASLAKAVAIAADDFPPEVSEIQRAKLSLLPSQNISVPRIANTLIQMECVLFQHICIQEDNGDLILGKVVSIHLHESLLDAKGSIDIAKLDPLARLAGSTYGKISDFFDV